MAPELRMKWQKIVLTGLVLVVCASSTSAQKRGAQRLKEDVDLPADFSLDFKLGAAERLALQNESSTLHAAELGQIGEEVFRTLIQNSAITTLSLPYQWSLSFASTEAINATSRADGEIRVNAGLAKLMGPDRGLWAAVLSHEIAHVARRHAAKKYLYKLYTQQLIAFYEQQARAGNKSAPWVLLGLRVAVPIAERKLSRSLEHDADIQGMKLMAVAGYHPDGVFALHHRVRLRTGDESKFAAFFQDHPRWETRDQRSEQAYAGAVQEFNRLWPNPSTSPGGEPALVAFAGRPLVKENKTEGTVDLHLPLYCRNAVEPLSLLVHLSKSQHELQTENPNYRNSSGNFEYRQEIRCLDRDDAAPLDVRLPANLVAEKDRKAKVRVEVVGPRGDILESFRVVDAHFPKNSGGVSAIITASNAEAPIRLKKRVEIEEHTLTKSPILETASPEVPEGESTALVEEKPLQQIPPSPGTLSRTNPLGILGSNETSGVKITDFTPNSAAAKAGLVVGDIILATDGKVVANEEALYSEMSQRKPGSKVVVTFMHIAWAMNATLTVPSPGDSWLYRIY
jgi:hypothetical protein